MGGILNPHGNTKNRYSTLQQREPFWTNSQNIHVMYCALILCSEYVISYSTILCLLGREQTGLSKTNKTSQHCLVKTSC